MSFSASLKEELSAVKVTDSALLAAECYGIALFGRAFTSDQIVLVTENEAVAARYVKLLDQAAGVAAQLHVAPLKKQRTAGLYTVSVKNPAARARLLRFFGHSANQFHLRINRANVGYDEGNGAFLRGVFLACGTLADPMRAYHLEFDSPFLNLTNDLLKLMTECALAPKCVARKGSYGVYFKESEQIEDFLTLIGATQASLSIMNIKIYKDIRNRANRQANCETANIDKTVAAAARQAEDIRLILERRGEEYLPEELREVAKLRLENPEFSLSELGQALPLPLSRSGVNHRLKRIQHLADELKEDTGR